ncbi:MAG: hypothetical protein JOZ24_07340, partial [Candidatus Eremiobacteraeota bacterium]|nr:hypothetical protein [Candidatus Eremiobacteraeota bacterium]
MRLAATALTALILFSGSTLCAVRAQPTAATAAPSESDGLAKAQRLFADRQFRQAIALLDGYIASHPRDPRALVLRGDAKASIDDNAGALRDYNTAIGMAP